MSGQAMLVAVPAPPAPAERSGARQAPVGRADEFGAAMRAALDGERAAERTAGQAGSAAPEPGTGTKPGKTETAPSDGATIDRDIPEGGAATEPMNGAIDLELTANTEMSPAAAETSPAAGGQRTSPTAGPTGTVAATHGASTAVTASASTHLGRTGAPQQPQARADAAATVGAEASAVTTGRGGMQVASAQPVSPGPAAEAGPPAAQPGATAISAAAPGTAVGGGTAATGTATPGTAALHTSAGGAGPAGNATAPGALSTDQVPLSADGNSAWTRRTGSPQPAAPQASSTVASPSSRTPAAGSTAEDGEQGPLRLVAAPSSASVDRVDAAPAAQPGVHTAQPPAVGRAEVSAPASAAPHPNAPQTTHTAPTLGAQLHRPLMNLAQAAPGEHVITLTVSPEHLGPVTVRAHVTADDIRIELFAPTELGRDAVRGVLSDLRRDLAGSGMSAQLELSSRDQPQGHQGERQQNEQQTQPRHGVDRPPHRSAPSHPYAADILNGEPNQTALTAAPGLDVTV